MDQLLDKYFNLKVMTAAFPEVLSGFQVTVIVSLAVIVFGILTGLVFAVLRSYKVRAIDLFIVAYVDIFRTLPQLVVIIFVYFGLPYAGLVLSPFATTVLALGLVLSAFATEIFRSAILAVPLGQWDAASALGFKYTRTLFQIILPQAIRLAIPLLTNRAIAISKGTALGTAVALPETLGQAQSVMSMVANPSPLTLAAAFYLTFFLPLVIASRWLERGYSKGQ
jgi:His/Glu/Gln/Arg/opine family amino acid ABC transporter permease subunit